MGAVQKDGTGSAYSYSWTGYWNEDTLAHYCGISANDNFGSSVSISGDGSRIITGLNLDDNQKGTDAGSALLFTWDDTFSEWEQDPSILLASDGTDDAQFGTAVSLSGDGTTMIIGAPLFNDDGAAYMYQE